jgi:hypothetical protein
MDLPGIDQTGLPGVEFGVVLSRPQTVADAAVHQPDGVQSVMEMPREHMAAARDPEYFQAGQAPGELDV